MPRAPPATGSVDTDRAGAEGSGEAGFFALFLKTGSKGQLRYLISVMTPFSTAISISVEVPSQATLLLT